MTRLKSQTRRHGRKLGTFAGGIHHKTFGVGLIDPWRRISQLYGIDTDFNRRKAGELLDFVVYYYHKGRRLEKHLNKRTPHLLNFLTSKHDLRHQAPARAISNQYELKHRSVNRSQRAKKEWGGGCGENTANPIV